MGKVFNALDISRGTSEYGNSYAILRFRGARAQFMTSVLQFAGKDPVWNCEGSLVYNGETALEIAVFDEDSAMDSADNLLAIGVLQIEQFCSGYKGMVPL